jgi:hypothetical protein
VNKKDPRCLLCGPYILIIIIIIIIWVRAYFKSLGGLYHPIVVFWSKLTNNHKIGGKVRENGVTIFMIIAAVKY